QRGVAERVHELTGEPASWPVFDVAVCTVEDLQRLKQPLKASFAFVLGEDHQLVFANAGRITETFLIDLIQKDSSAPSAWLRGYEGVEYGETVANLSRLYEPTASLLPEVKLVVDVGAGVGVASACFRTFHPQAAIHCFEMDPLALHLLQQNALSLGNCHVHPVGLAGKDGYKTRRLWPEDSQTEWGVEQVLAFREAKTALQELGLERIDVLRLATGGQGVEVLTSLKPWLKGIKVIYVEFGSEQDRKRIDQMLDPSHMIWQGEIIAGQRGSLCYLRRA
ncbi:methyltransferase, partial [Synechococcus sp. H55.10]